MTDGQKLQQIGWWFGVRVFVIAAGVVLGKLALVALKAV